MISGEVGGNDSDDGVSTPDDGGLLGFSKPFVPESPHPVKRIVSIAITMKKAIDFLVIFSDLSVKIILLVTTAGSLYNERRPRASP